jgi:hypothetical protein
VLDPLVLAAAEAGPRTGRRIRLGDEVSAITAVFARASGAALGVAFDACQGDGTYPVDRIERGGTPVGIMVDMTAPAYDNEILVPRRRGRREAAAGRGGEG